MTQALAKTPLHAWHVENGGRMVDFAGWSMPVQYGSIVAEHEATRTVAGLFDVSHMARFHFHGPGAERLLDRLVTRSVRRLPLGRICYALMTNEAGGILDDVLVYRLAARPANASHASPLGEQTSPAASSTSGGDWFQLVVNASNRAKIWSWIESHRQNGDEADVRDMTVETAMIAVQGPRAIELLRPMTTSDPAELKYYSGATMPVLGAPTLVSRTGYTGEDGWELVTRASAATEVWQNLLEWGRHLGARPAGLGCRDTLRLEAAMPLYGHELSESINPIQAGLKFAVELEDHRFIGREALERLAADATLPRRVGWDVSGPRPAREGASVLAEGRVVGQVTSGTMAPSLRRPIAMGFVEPGFAAVGTEMLIDIRGSRTPAKVVKLPFYRRKTC